MAIKGKKPMAGVSKTTHTGKACRQEKTLAWNDTQLCCRLSRFLPAQSWPLKAPPHFHVTGRGQRPPGPASHCRCLLPPCSCLLGPPGPDPHSRLSLPYQPRSCSSSCPASTVLDTTALCSTPRADAMLETRGVPALGSSRSGFTGCPASLCSLPEG